MRFSQKNSLTIPHRFSRIFHYLPIMRTRLLLLLPLALLLWGCPSDKDKDPEPEQEQGCRLQEITYEARFGQEPPMMTQKITFSYNKQGQLNSVSADSAGIPWRTHTMSYDSQGRLVQASSKRDVYLNEYNTQNQRVKQVRSYRGQNGVLQEHDYYIFSYNNRNELEEARYYYLKNGAPALYGTWRYTYSNGDPTTIKFHSPGSNQDVTITRLYDDKKRYPHEQAYSFFQPMEAPSEHNLVWYDVSDPNNHTPTYTAAYTYTSEDYPATMIKSFDNGMIEHFRYTYSCQ